MFNFNWPYAALLLPIPFFVGWFWRKRESSRETDGKLKITFPRLQALRSAFDKSSRSRRRLRVLPWLLAFTWIFFVVALMQPQMNDRINFEKDDGHDLMLAVDLSRSMESLDFAEAGRRQNRLDVAKNVVSDFVKKQKGDRVGLIVFGEHAYLQAPLTRDTAAVSEMLNATLPGMAGDATAIGDAIGVGIKNLRDRPAASRAIILLTDGEDNASSLPPLQAAKVAKEYGIRIYTVVVGKDGVVPFPDGNGGYAMVESHVDTKLTRQIAQETGGEFFRATDPAMLAKIYDHISTLQRSQADRPPMLVRRPLYQFPLALALALYLLYAGLIILRGDEYEFHPV